METIPLLTREEEKQLSKDVLGKSKIKKKKAIDKLVTSNIRLAIKIATRDFGWHEETDDIISEAVMGLQKAASKYDASFGAKFSSYAVWYIRQYIFTYINSSNLVPMSLRMKGIYHQIQRVANSLADELGYEPSKEEIADRVGIPLSRVEEVLGYKFSYMPLDSPFDTDDSGNRTLADMLEDENAILPNKQAEYNSNVKEVEWFFEGLQPREQFILKKRFGFGEEEPTTLEEIGKILKITRERTRQIQEIALNKIKKNLKKRENKKIILDLSKNIL